MSSQHSSDPPRSLTSRTWTTLSSPRPDSYSSEDASSERNMRRVILSPMPTDEEDYTDAEEVEAALAAVDDELSTTEEALTEWTSRTVDPYNFNRHILSMIAERSERSSRPVSLRSSTFVPPRPASATDFSSPIMRPENPAPRSMTPSSLSRLSIESLSEIQPSPERPLRHTTGRRAGDLIAFFEDKSASESSSSLSSLGQPKFSPLRSPTLTSSSSNAFSRPPLESSTTYSTFPRSTTLPTLDSRAASPTKSASGTLSSLLSPPRSGPYTETPLRMSNIGTAAKELPRVPGAPRSPLSTVRNIVAAWKERTPSLGKSSKPSSLASEAQDHGFFSIRRRDAVDIDRSLPPLPTEPLIRRKSSNGNGRKSVASTARSSLKSPFDVSELGPFAQSDREPIRLGQLWYLNVHAPTPYRWIRTQAILYPHSLLLTWIAPGGGRGVVTLDLLNCNEVRSVPSPSHPSAREDIGTTAAQEQASSTGPDGMLVEMLCPFQLLYPDGVERLGAESARERVRWVGAIWEALNRAVSHPDPSIRSHSPVPSIRTIRSESSSGTDGKSRSGSSSTVFVPPFESLPDISSISSSTRSSLIETGSAGFNDMGFHHRRASDDGVISNEGRLMPLERSGSRVIAPSRASSLRRTSSLENLDAEFATALSRSTPGSVGKPVTVSSGPSSSDDVFVSPPPSAGKKSRVSSAKMTSSDSDNSVYMTPPSRLSARTTATSSYYSLSSPPVRRPDSGVSTIPLRVSQTLSSGSHSLPNVVASTLSLRGSRSVSMLGDSHEGDTSDAKSSSSFTPTTPSKRSLRAGEPSVTTPTKSSGLARSPGIRRRTPRVSGSRTSSSSFNTAPPTLEGSDKENETASQSFATPVSPSTPTEKSYRSAAISGTPPTTKSRLTTPTATTERRTRTGRTSSYTSSIGYDVCRTSDLSDLSSSYPETLSSRSEDGGSVPHAASDSDVFLSASERTSFATARTPSPTSTRYTTASQAPSSTEYNSLSTCESSNYQSLETCPCPTEFQTATICPSTPSTQFVTAEFCPPSISSLSSSSLLSYQHTPPMPHSPTPTPSISMPSTVVSEPLPPSLVTESSISESMSIAPSSRPPSSMGTIPSLADTTSSQSFLPSTRLSPITRISTSIESEPVPLSEERSTTATEHVTSAQTPSSTSLISVVSTKMTATEHVTSVQTPSSTSLFSIMSTEIQTPSETSLVSPSSLSVRSVTSTSTISIRPLTPVSSLTPTENTYEESTGSYSSSVLQPSPSTASFVFPDVFDASFDTSFLRPSNSIDASEAKSRIPMTPRQATPLAISPPSPREVRPPPPPREVTPPPPPPREVPPTPPPPREATPTPPPPRDATPTPSPREVTPTPLQREIRLTPPPPPRETTLTPSPPPRDATPPRAVTPSPPLPECPLPPSTPSTVTLPEVTVQAITSPVVSPPTSVSTPEASTRQRSLVLSMPTTTSLLSALSRTASSVSSISMRSSVLAPSGDSLYDFEPDTPMESSSWPSSLSTESSLTPESITSSEPLTVTPSVISRIPSSTPPSPSTPSTVIPLSSTATPAPTFTVSISTPYSNVPSIASQLETIPSEETASEMITNDVNTLLEYLRGIDLVRNGQYMDLSQHLDRIDEELQQLASSNITKREDVGERPPPVPVKDVSVGRSSASRMSTPVPRRPPPVNYIDVPPPRSLSPSSVTTSISWLSSHYSDDFDRQSEDIEHLLVPAPPSSSPPSSPSTPRGSLNGPVDAIRPPSSTGTIRSMSLDDIRDSIGRLLALAAGLHDQHITTRQLIADIHRETAERQTVPPAPPAVVSEAPVQTTGETADAAPVPSCREMIEGIENKLKKILSKLESDETTSDGSDISSMLRAVTTPQPPVIHSPTPVPAQPPLSDLLSSFTRDAAPRDSFHLDPLPTIRLPHSPARPRSYTPPSPRRPRSVPVPAPDGTYRDVPPFRPSDSPDSPILAPQARFPIRGVQRPPPASVPEETDDVRMSAEIRADREQRRGDTDRGFFIPRSSQPPRPTIPPRVGSAPAETAAWDPPRHVAYARPRQRAAQREQTTTQADTTPSAPVPGGDSYGEILELLRNGGRITEAALEQATSTNRYLTDLNRWLAEDQADRHNEMQSLGARIDQLRNELAGPLGIRPTYPPGFVPLAPGAGVRGGPPIPGQPYRPSEAPPVGTSESEESPSPIIPPRPGILRHPQFPAGFVPQGPQDRFGMQGPPPGWFPQPHRGYAYPYPDPRFADEGLMYSPRRPMEEDPWDEEQDRFRISRRRRGDESPIMPPDIRIYPASQPSSSPRDSYAPIHSIPAGRRPEPDLNAPPPLIIHPPGQPTTGAGPSGASSTRPEAPTPVSGTPLPSQTGEATQQPIIIVPSHEQPPLSSQGRDFSRRGSGRSSPGGEQDFTAGPSRLDRPGRTSRDPSHSRSRPSSRYEQDRSRSPSPRGSHPSRYQEDRAPSPRGSHPSRYQEDRAPSLSGSRPSRRHRDSGRSISPRPSRQYSDRPYSGHSERPPSMIRIRTPSRGSDVRERSPTQTIILRSSSRGRSVDRRERRSGQPSTIILDRQPPSRSRSRRDEGGSQPVVVQVPGRSRSRSSSRSPTRQSRIIVQRSRSRGRRSSSRHTQPVVIQSSRHTDGSRSRSRSPSRPVIIQGDGRSRTRSRGHSRSPSRPIIIQGDGSRARSRGHSRSPSRPIIIQGDGRSRAGSRGHSRSPSRPIIIQGDGSRARSRGHSRSPPVVIQQTTRPRSRSRGRSRTTPVILSQPERRSRSRSRSRDRTVYVQQSRSRSRSGHRTTPIVVAPQRSRRGSSSGSSHRQVVVVPDERRRRSHSRHTPTQIIVQGDGRRSSSHRSHHTPAIIHQRSRSRSYSSGGSAPGVVVLPREGRRRSHSRHTPTQVIVQGDGRRSSSHRSHRAPAIIHQRSRSRSYSSGGSAPGVVVVPREGRHRSHSRHTPSQIIVQGDGRRSSSHHSRHTPAIIHQRSRSRSYSGERTPQLVVVPDEGRGRSHSRHTPTQVIVQGDGRHSGSHRSHHTPTIIHQRPRSRSYSGERSPQTVIVPDQGRRRSHSRHTPTQVIVQGDGHHSGSHRSHHTPTIIHQRPRSGSYSSEREPPVILTHDRRSHSPTSPIVLEGGSRSSHHTSHRPTTIISQRPRSRSLSPTSRTIMIDRSPSRSSRHRPTTVYTTPRRSRSRSPPIVIGEGLSQSRHGSRPQTIYTSHRGRSQSPPPLVVHEESRHGSRQPTVYATSHPRDRSQSPSSAIMPVLSRHDSGRSRPISVRTTRRSRSASPRSAPVYEASRAQTPTIIQGHDDERFPPRTGVLHGPSASPPRSHAGSIFEQPARPPSSHVSRRDREGSPVPLSDEFDRPRDALLTRPGTVVPSQGSTRGPSRPRSDLTGRREDEVVVPGAVAPYGSSRRSSPRDRDATPARAPSEMQYPDEGEPTVVRVRSGRHTPVSSRDAAASIPRGSHPSDIIPRPPPSDFEDEDHAPTIIPPDGSEAGFPRRTSPTRSFRVPDDARGISPPTGSPSPSADQRDGRTRSQARSQHSTGDQISHGRTERPLSEYRGDVPRDDELPPGVRTPEIGGPVRPPSRSVEDRYASAFNDAEDERRMRYTDAEQRRDRSFQEREATRQDTFEANEQVREERAEAAMRDILHATRGITPDEPALGESVPIDVLPESIRSEHTPPGPTASVVPSGPVSVRGDDLSRPASGPATIGPSVRGSSEGGIHVVPSSSDVGLHDAAHQEALRDDAAAEAEAERESAAALSEAGRNARSENAQSEIAESIHSVAQTIAAERSAWQARLEASERERTEMLEILQHEHEERVRQFQEEISNLKEAREAERIEKEKEEAERREQCEIKALERDAGLRDQLNDITNLLQEKKAECERLQKLNEERESVKEERRAKKDAELEGLRDLVQRIVDQNEAIRTQTAEDRIAQETKPGVEAVLEALEKQKQEQSALFNSMAEGWQSESQKQHQEVLEGVKASAQEQVPFNVKEYLEQFSQALADEVRMLLYEVGKLREEKRNIQFELGNLMCLRSKYGPGGEFDPDWRPNIPMYGGPPYGGPPGPPPPGGPGGPPPGDGFPPGDRPPPPGPAWRTVNIQPPAPPKLSKRQKRQQREAEEAAAAQAATQAGPSVQRTSWATWIPNPNLAPTPTSEQAELVAPPTPQGLWGPRESPRNGKS